MWEGCVSQRTTTASLFPYCSQTIICLRLTIYRKKTVKRRGYKGRYEPFKETGKITHVSFSFKAYQSVPVTQPHFFAQSFFLFLFCILHVPQYTHRYSLHQLLVCFAILFSGGHASVANDYVQKCVSTVDSAASDDGALSLSLRVHLEDTRGNQMKVMAGCRHLSAYHPGAYPRFLCVWPAIHPLSWHTGPRRKHSQQLPRTSPWLTLLTKVFVLFKIRKRTLFLNVRFSTLGFYLLYFAAV